MTVYMNKAPRGGTGIAMHQDTHYLRNEPNTRMACWIALSDPDPDPDPLGETLSYARPRSLPEHQRLHPYQLS